MATKHWKIGANDEVLTPNDLTEIEEAIAAINGGDTMPELSQYAEWNTIYISSPTVSNNSFSLNQSIGIYRMIAPISNSTAIVPTPSANDIPVSSSYYCFEMEVTIGSSAIWIQGPSEWTWVSGGGLPVNNIASKTIYISVRFDCSQRTFLANVWRVV